MQKEPDACNSKVFHFTFPQKYRVLAISLFFFPVQGNIVFSNSLSLLSCLKTYRFINYLSLSSSFFPAPFTLPLFLALTLQSPAPYPPTLSLLQVSEETRLQKVEAAREATKKALEERQERQRLHEQVEARHRRRRRQNDLRSLEAWPPEDDRKVFIGSPGTPRVLGGGVLEGDGARDSCCVIRCWNWGLLVC